VVHGSLLVRDAEIGDVPDIEAIYAHHVVNGLGTFELEPPSREEMTRRLEEVLAVSLPFLVATGSQQVVGYAYAAPYRSRPAYRHTVEDSVYVAPAAVRRGVGRALLTEVIRRCERSGARQMVAVIGDSANTGSVELHRTLGFDEVGVLRAVGRTLGGHGDHAARARRGGAGGGVAVAPIRAWPARPWSGRR
jgi:phosphinothricin acetyltransferase